MNGALKPESTMISCFSGIELSGSEFIKNIEDNSDITTKRMRVNFKNGCALSIIRGAFSHGGDSGLFEIALFDNDGNMNGELFDESDQGGTVLGYCDLNLVNHYMEKIGNLDA